MAVVLGVDVSVSRGLDVVVMDERRRVISVLSRKEPADLRLLIEEHHPDVVAIDSPPTFGKTRSSRLAERELLKLGIHSYATPSEKTERAFYDWMRVGHECFAASLAAGYPLYRAGPSVKGQAIEVFPHACAVVLAGRRPPEGWSRTPASKRRWREAVLQANDVETNNLRSLDHIDAALGSLTAVLALEGCFVPVGDPDEGVIVLPCRTLPSRYERETTAAANASPRIVEYSTEWPVEFDRVAEQLRRGFGNPGIRIDHIGSTAVPGLAAKDVIDVQVTLTTLDAPGFADAVERSGFRLRHDIVGDHRPPGANGPDGDWTKRYADSPPGEREVHVHFRVAGRPNHRYALLVRDYLRAHPQAAEAYARAKRELARLTDDTGVYADAKDPVTDLLLQAAEVWAAATGWAGA